MCRWSHDVVLVLRNIVLSESMLQIVFVFTVIIAIVTIFVVIIVVTIVVVVVVIVLNFYVN